MHLVTGRALLAIKKVRFLIISILLSLLFGYSYCQNKTDIIKDSFCGNPFILEKPDIQLPDNLGGRNLNGFATIVLTIDSSETILSYEVIKFKVTDKHNKIKINFNLTSKKHEAKIRKYKNWFDSYIKEIKITVNRQYDGRRQQKYNIGLMIKLNNCKHSN
jgi:hypothetical protein